MARFATVVLLLAAAGCNTPPPARPPAPPGPTTPTPLLAACGDRLDNDGDNRIDFPDDPGCFSATDGDEKNPQPGPGNAHRIVLWTSYEKLIVLNDAALDTWKSRGIDGIVVQTRYLDEMGGSENWTGDPNDPLSSTPVEGADVHVKQRTLRDSRFVERCHARGIAVYLGFYLSNYHNLSTPLKVWNDDAGWSEIAIPMVRNIAAAAKLLGMDGLATDSEMYRSEDQTWNWNYPGATQSEATIRDLARQRGRDFMQAVVDGFPGVEIINYRIEIPGDWEERVQAQVNRISGVWDRSVFPDFWNGITSVRGYAAIRFFDPIFYKSWHIRSGWDEALDSNIAGVRATLAKRWENWNYASERFFLSPFAWIDPGPSPGSFDDARPPDYVDAQLRAFHRWGEGNTFGLYAQHIDDFDYTPYVPSMQAASTPDAGTVVLTAQTPPDGGPATALQADIKERFGLPKRLEWIAAMDDVVDAAFVPDGRLFVAERSGIIRVVRSGGVADAVSSPLEDVWTADGNGLRAIAIDPDFERTHHLYAVYTAASRSGVPVFRLVRFREVQNTFAERVVLLDNVPAAPTNAAAALRFGPDAKLYVAFDNGGDSNRVEDLASYNGKVLRLNSDGGTPQDQLMATPVFAYGVDAPRGLAWQPDNGALWIAGRNRSEGDRVRRVGAGDIRSNRRLDPGIGTRGGRIGSTAFVGHDLIVAGSGTPAIARIRFDPADATRIIAIEPLLDDAGGDVTALTMGPDGAIYFCANGGLHRLRLLNR